MRTSIMARTVFVTSGFKVVYLNKKENEDNKEKNIKLQGKLSRKYLFHHYRDRPQKP
jgi:hypothetical protein